MYTFRNPPPEHYLEEMARVNCRFTLRHAACAPKLRLNELHVDAAGDDVYHISVVVDNVVFLATNLSDQALAMREAKPVTVTLSGPDDLTFMHGQQTQEIGHLAGRFGRNMAYTRFYDWPASKQCVRWTVIVPRGAELELSAGCPRTGILRTQFALDNAS